MRVCHLKAAVVLAAFALFGRTPSTASAQASTEEGIARDQLGVVRFRGADLFEVRAAVGTLQARERARAIEQRLGRIAAGSPDALGAIHVVERDHGSDLVVGEQLVLSVTDADASALGRTRQQLAADYSARLYSVLSREFSGRSLRGITTAAVLTVVATLVLVLAWRVLGSTLRQMVKRVQRWEGTHITAMRVKNVEIVSAHRMTLIASRSVELLRLMLLAIAGAVYLELVLGFFPWTRGAALQLRSYVGGALSTTALAILTYLPNLVYIALIALVVRFVLRTASLIFASLGRGELRFASFHPEWAAPTYKIVRLLILAFGAVVIFPYLPGAGSPAFQGVSIFFGVLLSLGSSSAISNVVAGIVMTYMIPFRPGERVQIGDTVGDVVEMNLLVVRVRTIKNVEVTIPNSAVLSGHVTNYSSLAKNGGLILHTTVTIGYDAPWRQVHQLLTGAATRTTGILSSPKPFVLQTSLDDFYVSYQINAYTDQPNAMAVIYGELHQNIQDEFASAGVEIMSPHYRAVRDGGSVTLPLDQLPGNYVAPAFRVTSVPDVGAAVRE